jgi:uncharacterized protein YceK
MRRLVLPFLVAAMLAGCSSEPRVASSTPPGVSYRFTGDDVAEANRRADRYCAQYGKRAQLQGVTRGATDNIAAYQCG